jgi:hypothetical protein
MKHLEDVQERRAEQPSSRREGRTRRCYQCNGCFGLIRHRVGLKHFCSRRCLRKYKADIERATTRLKEWTHFLSSPENLEGDMFARATAKRRLLGLDASDWSMLVAGIIFPAADAVGARPLVGEGRQDRLLVDQRAR